MYTIVTKDELTSDLADIIAMYPDNNYFIGDSEGSWGVRDDLHRALANVAYVAEYTQAPVYVWDREGKLIVRTANKLNG